MKILFNDITFEQKPLLWEYDEDKNHATCLFLCVYNSTSLNIKSVLEVLREKNHPSFIIKDDSVLISDVQSFIKQFPMSPYLDLSLLKENSSLTKINSTSTEQQNFFFNRSLQRQDTLSYDNISLDYLIPKNNIFDPGIWGDTVSYESYFANKNISDNQTRSESHLKNELSINLMVQYQKNVTLYPLKSKLIKTIRQVLDDYLNAIYMQWAGSLSQSSRKPIYLYFRQAVREAMINGPFNINPTEFETDPESERMRKFNNNPFLLNYAITQARATRAHIMLMKFIVLIHEEYPLKLATTEVDACEGLCSLKEKIQTNKESLVHLKKLLNEMQALVIETGIVELKNAQLSNDLKTQFNNNETVICNFNSFRALLLSRLSRKEGSLKKSSKNRSDACKRIAEETTKNTIELLISRYNEGMVSYITKLRSTDANFYLSNEWTEGVRKGLMQINIDELLKSPDKSKLNIQFSKSVAEFMIEFINSQMLNNKSEKQEKNSNSSSGLGTN